jgi:hypothetical protein
MTRWLYYLYRRDFLAVARLARLPDRSTKPELFTITKSLERLVRAAYTSICEDKINVFN